MAQINYRFSGSVWRHNAPGGWYFVSLPKDQSSEIRSLMQDFEEGWGRLKARATIQNVTWDTAIWFDTKLETYILPLKASVRNKLQIKSGEDVTVQLAV